MINDFRAYFKDALIERSIDAGNDNAANHEGYRDLSKAISTLEIQITKGLSDEMQDSFSQYVSVLLRRDALMQELMYLQGFKDEIIHANDMKKERNEK